MEKREKNNVWLIAYIHRDHIHRVEKELLEYGYKDIEAYIPTVKLLQKKFKGHNVFEFVPLLFNYGFFRIPYQKACDPDFLIKLKTRITCIYGWVKDIAKVQINIKEDELDYIKALPGAAIATDKEILNLQKTSKNLSIFTAEDLKRIKVGDMIVLQGYPFENVPAEIIEIDFKKAKVKVKMDIATMFKEVEVSFENVFYTIYKDYSEEGKEKSTEEIDHRAGYGLTDNLLFTDFNYIEETENE